MLESEFPRWVRGKSHWPQRWHPAPKIDGFWTICHGINSYSRWVVFKLYSIGLQHPQVERENVFSGACLSCCPSNVPPRTGEQNARRFLPVQKLKSFFLHCFSLSLIWTHASFLVIQAASHLTGSLVCENFSFAHMDGHMNHFRILQDVAIKMTLAHMFDCRADIYYRSNSFYSINKGFDLFISASLSKHSSSAKKSSRFRVSGPYIYHTHAHVCAHMQTGVHTHADILPTDRFPSIFPTSPEDTSSK